MKRTINVAIGGCSFTIDEDAYNTLNDYLERFKAALDNSSASAEVMDELEVRIADQLKGKLGGRQVVDLAMTQDVIGRLGYPEGYKAPEDQTGTYEAPKEEYSYSGHDGEKPVRKLFRDPDGKRIAGVCSGLAQYFGGQDPLLWRVVVCALAICSLGITLLLYLLIWIVAPVARTPEEKLRMKGMEVNSTNLSEQIIEDNNEEKLPRRNEAGQIIRAILWVIMIILIGLIVVPLLLVAGSFLFCIIVAATIFSQLGSSITIDTYQHIPNTSPFLGTEHLWLIELLQQSSFSAWGFLISGLVATVIPIYAFIRLIRKNPDNNMSFGAKVALTLIWILALVFCIWCFGITTYNFQHL